MVDCKEWPKTVPQPGVESELSEVAILLGLACHRSH